MKYFQNLIEKIMLIEVANKVNKMNVRVEKMIRDGLTESYPTLLRIIYSFSQDIIT